MRHSLSMLVVCGLLAFSKLAAAQEPERQKGQSAPRSLTSQERFLPPDRAVPHMTLSVRKDCRRIFTTVQQGLSSGNVGTFSPHLAAQVYMNLRGNESGYFSSSQAYYVLENFLRARKLGGFSFSTIGESETSPYATGSAGFNNRGARELAQIYVSLSLAGDRWVISQINIY